MSFHHLSHIKGRSFYWWLWPLKTADVCCPSGLYRHSRTLPPALLPWQKCSTRNSCRVSLSRMSGMPLSSTTREQTCICTWRRERPRKSTLWIHNQAGSRKESITSGLLIRPLTNGVTLTLCFEFCTWMSWNCLSTKVSTTEGQKDKRYQQGARRAWEQQQQSPHFLNLRTWWPRSWCPPSAGTTPLLHLRSPSWRNGSPACPPDTPCPSGADRRPKYSEERSQNLSEGQKRKPTDGGQCWMVWV